MRDFHYPGRSPVYAANGLCAASHPLAAEAAVSILRAGGNAMDAAITANAVLCVVEPMSTGPGGDCFAILAKDGGRDVIGYNGSGRAPRAADTAWFLEQGIRQIDPGSIHAVTAPGAVEGWCRLLADHGTMDMGAVLEPAIALARDGFPVSPRIAWEWGLLARRLGRDKAAARHYLPRGRAPRTGERVVLPALADTLAEIARHGRDGFYRGWVAEDMLAALKQAGGLLDADDFAATRGTYVTPVRVSYGGHEVLELPPNGQGVTALIMLNILSCFETPKEDDARLHLQVEAARAAYALRDRHVADPDFYDVPLSDLLSRETAVRLAANIDPGRASVRHGEAAGSGHKDTVYLAVVDRDRFAVSFINSLYHGFGVGRAAPRCGVLFQNRGAGFVVEPGHPNSIQGGKRPLHTIIPGMLMKNGRTAMAFGVMGGAYQPVGHVHLLTGMLDYGMDVQEALDAPRLFYDNGQVAVERGISAHTRNGLARRGHVVGDAFLPLGGGQAVVIDEAQGALVGGSDPRKDGAAIGY